MTPTRLIPRTVMFIGVAVSLLTLAACGPVYRTQHTFTEPTSPEGRTCVFQCQTSKLQCQQIEDLRKDRCEDRADRDRERCIRRLERQKKEVKSYDCPLDTCSADYERCEEMYRACYQSCGGTITSETVCVSGGE